MPDSTLSTLQQIIIKVRRVTASPSTAQLTDQDIINYINTFLLYDLPQDVRLFDLRTTLTFYTQPYVDIYDTNTTDPNDPLYNFKNKYISVHPPVYCAGYNLFLSQSREQFYGIYPLTNSIMALPQLGDGNTTNFTGTLSSVPVVANQVLFSSIATNNTGLALYDDGNGNLTGNGTGTINYVTGQFVLNYSSAPALAAQINSQTIPYQPSIPQGVCYYDDMFIFRPIPDQPYRIDVEAFIRPSELLSYTQSPEISEWWQYIAYGAIIKVFQDRRDDESVMKVMSEFIRQKDLVLSKTSVQNSNKRVATIYTEQANTTGGGGNGWNSGNSL